MPSHHFVIAFRAHAAGQPTPLIDELTVFVDRLIEPALSGTDFLTSVSPGGLILAVNESTMQTARRLVQAATRFGQHHRRFALSAAIAASDLQTISAHLNWYGPNFEGEAVIHAARVLQRLPPGALGVSSDLPWEDDSHAIVQLDGKHAHEKFAVRVIENFFPHPHGFTAPPPPWSAPGPRPPVSPLSGTAKRQREPKSSPPTPPSRDPYPVYLGLKTYDRRHALYYFGRRDEIVEYLELIADTRYQTLLVKGGSGVGKSSFMMAGVLPHLPNTPESDSRNSLYFHPGSDDPFRNLAEVLNRRRPTSRQQRMDEIAAEADRLYESPTHFVRVLEQDVLATPRRVIYIDQLEELLVEASSVGPARGAPALAARRLRFVAALKRFLDHNRANYVVATIRADAVPLMEREQWRDLTDLFKRGVERWLRVPEQDSDIDEIVTGPAGRAQFEVEPKLLTALRTDIKQEVYWTPLLSACLEEMVELLKRSAPEPQRRELTLAQYQEVGGVQGVIERRATSTMAGLTGSQLKLLQELFPLLVRVDEQTGQPTKGRFPLHDPGISSAQRDLADILIRSRLLVSEGQVELIHDALFARWRALRDWLKHSNAVLHELNDFRARASTWKRLRHPKRKLLTGEEVESAKLLLERHPSWTAINPEVKAFVSESASHRNLELFVNALKDGDLNTLKRLMQSGVRLSADQLEYLDQRHLPFYYALYPDQAFDPSTVKPGTAFEAASLRRSQDSNRMKYFAKEHLELTTGVSRLTVQHFAAMAGNIDVLEALVALGADLSVKSHYENAPIVSAAIGASLPAFKWLHERARDRQAALATVDKNLRSPLYFAAGSGAEDIIRYILEQGLDVDVNKRDKDGWSPVQVAVFQGGVGCVKLLVESGRCDVRVVDEFKRGLLHLAIELRNWELVRYLLTALRPDDLLLNTPTSAGETPLSSLISAARGNDGRFDPDVPTLVKILIAKGADPRREVAAKQVPPLARACESGSVEVVEVLLPFVDINDDLDGRTALHHALESGHSSVALRLLQEEAIRVDARDVNGQLAMERAIASAFEEVTRQFLTRGALAHDVVRDAPLVALALATADSESVHQRGRIAERLLDEGARRPLYASVEADESGRLIGLKIDVAMISETMTACAKPDLWSLPPTVRGEWEVLESADAARFLASCVQGGTFDLLEFERFRPMGVRRVRLRCYEDTWLYEIPVIEPITRQRGYWVLLVAGDERARLRGEANPLHIWNERLAESGVPPIRNIVAAMHYLTLFCAVVQGDGGVFRVLEGAEQVLWLDESKPEHRERLVALYGLEPGHKVADGPSSYVFSAPILYGGDAFRAKLTVAADGDVVMNDDEGVVSGLLIRVERFVNGVRVFKALR